MKRRKTRLKVLLYEYNMVNQRIEQFLDRQDRILQYGLFAILAVFTGTLKWDEIGKLIPFIPFGIFLIISFLLYHYDRNFVNHGYRRHLEIEINKICEKNVVFYSLIGNKKLMSKNPYAIINTGIMFVLYLAFSIYGIQYLNQNKSHYLLIFILMYAIIFITVICIYIIRTYRINVKIFDYANKLSKEKKLNKTY